MAISRMDPSLRTPLMDEQDEGIEVVSHRQRQYSKDLVCANAVLFVAEASRGLVLASLSNVCREDRVHARASLRAPMQ
jgi:hypothetical protein